MSDLIIMLLMIALRGTTILPDMIVHFDISRVRSVKAVEEAMLHDQKIFLITQKDTEVDDPGQADVYKIDGSCHQAGGKAPKGVLRVLVEGLERQSFWDSNPERICWKQRLSPLKKMAQSLFLRM